MNEAVRAYARIALVALILIGAFWVLAPFLAALMFAAILCLSTWPLFVWVETRVKGRATLAALLTSLILAVAVLLPMSYLAATVTDGVTQLLALLRDWFAAGDWSPPAWLSALPLIGDHLDAYWRNLAASQEDLARLGQQLFEPTRRLLLAAVGLIGQGLLELTLVVFIAFFFYRDGRALAAHLDRLAEKIGAELGQRMLKLAHTTIMGVMVGIVGTAAAQALLALVGFLIAGVPAPLLLSSAVFFLSMIPVGPPLIWGGAAWWLYGQGEMGMAIFMVIWGVAVISSVDNFLKPILISRTSSLPILLIALGVFGGILAFGFVGIFLGPVILALALTLVAGWSSAPPANPA
ncbi:MAG: AI-2E family transporter [Gammaproteobacteria bacterium]|nr:AI-2E family transporter [Rhodocyclaceae bacterium]MBU3910687.1 AI-2E family transporter [Gammaproteobacteria bacterium]MBU3988527.1 AI-2E family transporter [Gammaproteobacteria bacterium]MBU4003396.1 AI-2E family transporter [Gammaproteobacteria bacterium]MBU4021867.1 AI-2E family transporter [Gammaproteobacteria bacterium]